MWIELALRTLLLDAVQRSGPREGADIRIRRDDGRAVVEIASRGVETPELDAQGVSEMHPIGQHIAAKGLGEPGTGLYISKLIAERHGGEIGCAPEDSGEGRFYFSLPAMAEGSTARGEAAYASSPSDR
jgi:signal transduction histidine kinase